MTKSLSKRKQPLLYYYFLNDKVIFIKYVQCERTNSGSNISVKIIIDKAICCQIQLKGIIDGGIKQQITIQVHYR